MILKVDQDLSEIEGNRKLFLQLFQNLIENAVKYMGDQLKPRIQVGIRRTDEDVVCFVEDNGIGIESEYRERVFRVFEKLDPQSEGTGIGLALAKHTVSSWGARIWIESDGRGKGTRVCFTLPRGNASEQAGK